MTENTKQTTQHTGISPYVGRFAPSPSGPLHFGSLLTALASYLDARAHHGKFLLRIDNIDQPREIEGASESIIQCLSDFYLQWDGDIIYQSERYPFYIDFLITLIKADLVYPCYCSRKQLSEHNQYPGTCRKTLSIQEKQSIIDAVLLDSEHVFSQKEQKKLIPLLSHYNLRLNTQGVDKEKLEFVDLIQGQQYCPDNFGDFILLRRDRLPSYMLACAVDDLYDGISHIIRGSDLLESTFWQRCLQQYFLNFQSTFSDNPIEIHYGHLPIITNELNQKLSKQHHAPAIEISQAREMLLLALGALNQESPDSFSSNSVMDILEWSVKHWSIEKITKENIAFDSLSN